MKNLTTRIALTTLIVLGASTLMSAPSAQAQRSKGKRNLALGLGAVAGYGLLRGNKTLAVGGGLGAAYAYNKYRKSGNNNRYNNRNFANSRYDSRGNRYADSSRHTDGRSYYDSNGRLR